MSMGNWPFLLCLFPDNWAGHHSLGCNALLWCLWALSFHSPRSLAASLLLIISAISRKPCCRILHCCPSLPSLLATPPFTLETSLPSQAGCYSPKKDNIFFQSTPVDNSQEKIKEAAFVPAQPFKATEHALIHLCIQKLSTCRDC